MFFNYPKDIRKAIYTTNAIESLNSVIRTAVNKRKVFPSDQAAFKVVYLATQQASKKWSMPIRNWTSALILDIFKSFGMLATFFGVAAFR